MQTTVQQEIRSLYMSGRTQRQLAAAYGISEKDVRTVVRDLMQDRSRHLEDGVFRLYRDGRSDGQIARALGVGIVAVKRQIAQLRQAGLVSLREKFQTRSTVEDPTNERVRTIIEMTRKGATLEELGTALGCTRERARQLRDEIITRHGPELVGRSELLTTKEAAEILGVSRGRVWPAATAAGIRVRAPSGRFRGFSANQLDKLRAVIDASTQGTCLVCGKSFARGAGSRRFLCSVACKKRRGSETRAELLSGPPTETSRETWHVRVWQALQGHTMPTDEQWMGIAESAKLTGLSKTQVWYLGMRGILTTRPHPTKKWGGKPRRLYARSQLMVAARVWREELEQRRERRP